MYEAIDYFTREVIIRSKDVNKVKAAMKRWLENNPSSCIQVYKDGVLIYG